MPRTFSVLIFVVLLLAACQNAGTGPVGLTSPDAPGKSYFSANYGIPVLDGSGADDLWEACEWLPMEQIWAGQTPDKDDFSGRYKLAWDENNLYIHADAFGILELR